MAREMRSNVNAHSDNALIANILKGCCVRGPRVQEVGKDVQSDLSGTRL